MGKFRGLGLALRLGVSTLALLALAALVGCEESGESSGAAGVARREGALPQQQIFDYRLIESDRGIRQWVLQSEEMLKYSGQEDLVLVVLEMDFFRDGEHFSTLTADSGLANQFTKNIHTWGNVVVETNDGRKLETEDLFFNNETQLIHNDVFNRFTRQGDVVTGMGLEATPDLEYIEIKNRVEADVEDQATENSDQP